MFARHEVFVLVTVAWDDSSPHGKHQGVAIQQEIPRLFHTYAPSICVLDPVLGSVVRRGVPV